MHSLNLSGFNVRIPSDPILRIFFYQRKKSPKLSVPKLDYIDKLLDYRESLFFNYRPNYFFASGWCPGQI